MGRLWARFNKETHRADRLFPRMRDLWLLKSGDGRRLEMLARGILYSSSTRWVEDCGEPHPNSACAPYRCQGVGMADKVCSAGDHTGLGRQAQGPLNIAGQRESLEQAGRVDVVLARFIDHTDEIVRFRVRIIHYWIQLSDLQRGGKSGVSDAHCKTMRFHSTRSHSLIYKALDLEFLPADTRCLVPVKLHFPYRTIRQSHIGEALSFPPPALAIEFAQTRKFANRLANRERLHVRKFAEDLEEHYQ
jgi:hypothetical protein